MTFDAQALQVAVLIEPAKMQGNLVIDFDRGTHDTLRLATGAQRMLSQVSTITPL